jgi:hypothetical protein
MVEGDAMIVLVLVVVLVLDRGVFTVYGWRHIRPLHDTAQIRRDMTIWRWQFPRAPRFSPYHAGRWEITGPLHAQIEHEDDDEDEYD